MLGRLCRSSCRGIGRHQTLSTRSEELEALMGKMMSTGQIPEIALAHPLCLDDHLAALFLGLLDDRPCLTSRLVEKRHRSRLGLLGSLPDQVLRLFTALGHLGVRLEQDARHVLLGLGANLVRRLLGGLENLRGLLAQRDGQVGLTHDRGSGPCHRLGQLLTKRLLTILRDRPLGSHSAQERPDLSRVEPAKRRGKSLVREVVGMEWRRIGHRHETTSPSGPNGPPDQPGSVEAGRPSARAARSHR